MAKKETVLCRRRDRPDSLVRVDAELFESDNAKAKARKRPEPWVKVPDDAESTGKTFDQLTPAEQKKVVETQAERKAAKEAEEGSDAEEDSE